MKLQIPVSVALLAGVKSISDFEQAYSKAEKAGKEWDYKQVKKWFLDHDESSKWPVNGKFNITKKCINFLDKNDPPTNSYEYGLALDTLISNAVNYYGTHGKIDFQKL